MELNRVEIRNFRSIAEATVEFNPRCRILVGKNEAGKSNILAACALLDEERAVSPLDLREAGHDEPPVSDGSVEFIFRLSLEQISLLKERLHYRILGHQHDVCVSGDRSYTFSQLLSLLNEFSYVVTLPDGIRTISYKFDQSDINLARGWLVPKFIVDRDVVVHGNGKTVPISEVSFAHSSQIDEKSMQYFEEANAFDLFEAITVELNPIVFAVLPKCLFWSYTDENLLPPSIDIEAFKRNPKTCEPLKAMFMLAGYLNCSEAIADFQAKPGGLRRLLNRVSETTTSHIRSRWPEIGSVKIVLSPNGPHIDAAVEDEFNQYVFSSRSDGFKRFVSFLILISSKYAFGENAKWLFIQDEPDLGLHPSGVKSLLKELIDVSKENYVLISTHSIFMIDKEKIERHILVSKGYEKTRLQDVEKSELMDEEVIYNALGYSVFDLVKPKNILFEGWRDKRIFLAALDRDGDVQRFIKSRLASDVGVAHSAGVKEIRKWVMIFDAIGRDVLVVTDGDSPARQYQAQFDTDARAHKWCRYDEMATATLPDVTAEDFIDPNWLASSLRAVLSKNGYDYTSFSIDFGDPSRNALSNLDRVLSNFSLSEAAKKDLKNFWKNQVFDGLELQHILTSYDEIVFSVAQHYGFDPNGA